MTENDGRNHVEFKFRVVSRTRVGPTTGGDGGPKPRKFAVLGCALLVVGMSVLLWVNRDFGRYAVTGLFWSETGGTVVSERRTSTPTVRYKTSDGVLRSFSEDYIILCGSRSFCFARDFDPGDVVPVVYDPWAPQKAFIDDWALRSSVITWFLEAGAALILALILVIVVRRKPITVRYRIG